MQVSAARWMKPCYAPRSVSRLQQQLPALIRGGKTRCRVIKHVGSSGELPASTWRWDSPFPEAPALNGNSFPPFPTAAPPLLPAARRNRWSNHPPPLPGADPCCYPAPRAVVIHIIRQISGQCSILEEVELHQGKTRIPIYLRQEMGHFCVIAKNCGQEMECNRSPRQVGCSRQVTHLGCWEHS